MVYTGQTKEHLCHLVMLSDLEAAHELVRRALEDVGRHPDLPAFITSMPELHGRLTAKAFDILADAWGAARAEIVVPDAA